MATILDQPNREARESTRARLRQVFAELEALCASGRRGPAFHGEFLRKSVSGMGAEAGALWRITEHGPELIFQRNLNAVGLTQFENERLIQKHHELLMAAGSRHGSWGLLPGESLEDSAALNPLDRMALLASVQDDREILIYELMLTADDREEMRDAAIEFMQRTAFLLTRFGHVSELVEFQRRENVWQELVRFTRLVHSSLDVAQTAYTIAHEGRSLLACDRFSVVVRRGTSLRTEAVSGVESIDPYSATAETLSELAAVVSAAGEPLLFDGDFSSLPPQMETVLERFLDCGGARGLAVFPIYAPRGPEGSAKPETAPLGAVVAEFFGEEKGVAALPAKMSVLREHVCLALNNALECDQTPLFRPLNALTRSPLYQSARGANRWLIALGACVLAAAIGMIPIPFNARASGVLTPAASRVFAPVDGKIVELRVKHGDNVHKGDVLAQLRNEKLEADVEYLRGDLASKEDSLLALRRRRSDKTTTRDADIVAELSQLESEVEYLHKAVAIRERELASQTVVAPVSGKVQTWDLEQRLNQRPVQRGQLLLEIAESPERWRLDLELPERYAGCVVEHSKVSGGALQASYVTGADASVARTAAIQQISMRMNKNNENQLVLTATADIQEPPPHCSAGQTVFARIECGQKPLAIAIGYDLIDIARRMWFRL